MRNLIIILAVTIFIQGCVTSPSKTTRPLRIPHVFGDNMVLQREQKIPVWGLATPGAEITVKFGDDFALTKVEADGSWKLGLPPFEASNKGRIFSVESDLQEKIEFKDVLVGDVWVCSGQSNMEMPTGKQDENTYRGIIDYEKELQDSDYPEIRLLNVPRMGAAFPSPDVPVKWEKCHKTTAYWFSAVAFTFGRELNKRQNIPVGLINASLGGAYILRFMPRDGFDLAPEYFAKQIKQLEDADKKYAAAKHPSLEEWKQMVLDYSSTTPPQLPSKAWTGRDYKYPDSGHACTGWGSPSALFNGMINPLIPYAIKGVIWYQGESDLAQGEKYKDAIKALVTSWRKHWGQGDFPFYAVEIAPYDYTKSNWPMKNAPADQRDKLVKGQRGILELENTGIVQTDDVGEMDNIHPRNKAPIGKRLADLVIKNNKNNEK